MYGQGSEVRSQSSLSARQNVICIDYVLTCKKPTKIFSCSPILNKFDLMRISVIELFSQGLDRFLTIKSQKFLSFFRYLYSENVREERDRPTKAKT